MEVKNKKIILLAFLCFVSFQFFSGCTDTKPLEKKITALENENKILKDKIRELESENKKLKETDDYYWQSAIELLNNNDYDSAIKKLNELKEKFPQTKLKELVNQKLFEINKTQNDLYKKLLGSLQRTDDIEAKIEKIKNFLNVGFSLEFKEKAQKLLASYEHQYEKIKKLKEFEKTTGIKIESIKTSWEQTSWGSLYHPFVRIRIRNISQQTANLKITIDYIEPETKEIFDTASEYMNIKPGYSKTTIIYPATGYKLPYFLPRLIANISINDTFITTVAVE